MKKLSRIAALLAAGSLLFGFASCSDGGSSGGGSDPVPDPTPASGTTYAWAFSDITTSGINAEDAGGTLAGKYVLAADYKYASTPAGLIMTMGKGDAGNGFVYNKIDPTLTVGESSQTDIYGKASVGAVEPAGDLLVIKNVTGPFTVLAYVSANGSSDKTDRYAYIKVGAEGEEAEVSAPLKSTTTVPVAGQTLSYNYEGTDKVNVIIGCEKYLRVYDVKITSAVTQDQSDGTVVTFTPSTNSSTANNLSTLGLVGASVASSSDSIATAVISEGNISVTSVAEGTATITVTDANSKTASFKAIVAEDGLITIGSITKFTRTAPTVEVTAKASAANSADGEGTVTWDALTDLEWSLDGIAWATSAEVVEDIASFAVSVVGTTATVTGIPAGTYYVRGKASEAYEASATATVNILVDGSTACYELDFSKLTTLAAGTKGTFTSLAESTVFFSDTLKKESVKWTAKSSSIPEDFTNPSVGLTMSSGKMGSATDISIQNAVKIVTTGPATLTAYVTVQTKAKALTMNVYGSDYASIKDTTGVTYMFDGESATLGTAVESSTATDTDNGGALTLHKITVTLPDAGTYYLGDTGDGKIQYGYLAVEM